MSTAQTIGKIVAMAGTVILTSGDDALWLVPFIASPQRSTDRHALNMTVWFLTLLSLVGVAEVVLLLGVGLGQTGFFETLGMNWPLELCLSFIGVVIAWTLVLLFFLKWSWKLYRKAQKKALKAKKKAQKSEDAALLQEPTTDYAATEAPRDTALEPKQAPAAASDVCTVISLTITGGLDEVAYFPSLLLTQVFTVWEMAMGTALAAVVLLVVLKCCLAYCTPVLELMDKIPLWVIVSIFASVMTILFTVELSEN